jgi:hypothetical protein
MSSRSRLLVCTLLVCSLASVASADRRRAVRAKTPECSFFISAGFADPILPSGLIRGAVTVSSNDANCTSWAGYSDVSWATIEQEGNVAYVSVLPNETMDVRVARVRIAGVQMQLTQLPKDDSGPISPPIPSNLLANGTFDTDLRAWGWLDRFPNGNGTATWSNLDANNSAGSGSMRLRDDVASGPAYQQLQCINVTGPVSFVYGAAVRSSSRAGARPVFAFVEYDAPDCAGNYPQRYPVQNTRVATENVWERRDYMHTISATAKSVSLIISAYAVEGGVQEVWFDDVYLRVP